MPRAKIMIASSVACTDEFMDCSKGAQALYFQLNFECNADGLIPSVRKVIRGGDFTNEEFAELLKIKLILECEGAYYIRHYWVNNKYDRSNHRAVGLSPEIFSQSIIFEGIAYKSPYLLAEMDSSSNSLPKECEQTGNGNGIASGSDRVTGSTIDNGREESIDRGKTKGMATGSARCPICGCEVPPAAPDRTGTTVFDCSECGRVTLDNKGRTTAEPW